MKLYLIRHGQSEANFAHYFAGQTQVNLTVDGRKQAEKLLWNYQTHKLRQSLQQRFVSGN